MAGRLTDLEVEAMAAPWRDPPRGLCPFVLEVARLRSVEVSSALIQGPGAY